MGFDRAVLIYNPAAGRPRERAAAVAALVRHAAALELAIEACPTNGPGQAGELARAAAARGVPLVIAHGGDGTVNEVVQGLVGSSTVLAVWPGGTANVLARELGMPKEPAAMARRLADGATRRIALGQMDARYFVLMAGIGLDASIAAGVKPGLKRRWGQGAFGLSAVQHAFGWRPRAFAVQWEDGTPATLGTFAVVGNTHSYGGGFQMTPGARLEEPLLEVCVIAMHRPWQMARFLVPALLGRHAGLPGVTIRKVQQVKILGNAPVQVDGELAGHLPATFRVVPDALTLLV